MNSYARFRVGLLLLLTLKCLTACVAQARQPNIVLIVTDDLGQRDLGCYGNTFYETPRLDKFAAQGVRFTDAYAASPICSPTRASLVTGKHPARLHLTDYIPGRFLPHAKLKPPNSVQDLALEEETLAEQLAAAGYVTAHVGKWHLGSKAQAPEHQGYLVNIGGSHLGLPHTYFSPYRLPSLPEGPQDEYLTDRLSAEAVKFVEAHREKPFFLSLCYYAVHTPIQGKPEYRRHYKEKGQQRGEKWNEGFAAMVQSVDEGVGKLLDAIESLGLAEETVVIFTSDNGGTEGITNNHPFRAGKGYVYEGGIRVPLVIRWPGKAPAGKTCATPVCSIDFKATCLEIAGIRPASATANGDGLSLLPLLERPEARLPRASLTFYYPHYSPQGGSPSASIRVGNWKLVESYEQGELELYDLSADIGEKDNLARKMPEKTAQLAQILHEQLREYEALEPAENPNYDPQNPLKGAYFAPWVP